MQAQPIRLLAVMVVASLVSAAAIANTRVLVSPGDPAPGTDGLVFSFITTFNLNDTGQVLFFASAHPSLDATTPGVGGLWIADAVGVTPIVIEGQPVPGRPGTFFEATFIDCCLPFNNAGDVVFEYSTTPLDGEFPRRGLFTWSGFLREARTVVLEGETFDVSRTQDGSDVRVVERLSFTTTEMRLNDFGEFVFGLDFVDGGSGLFLDALPCSESDVAEPFGELDAFDLANAMNDATLPEDVARALTGVLSVCGGD